MSKSSIMFVSRKYEQRRKKLRQSLAWWEDQNLDVDDKLTRKKISFKDRNESGSTNLAVDGQSTLNEYDVADKTISNNLIRIWKRIGRVLNIANTLTNMKPKEREEVSI